eukprot:TRINITY_DN12936_c0_g1_i3.p1 TRINITY_DN12936_c0_g1~~TRINITY_DN12936_c0_g1_i3.p1  ORF type:complete len:262 (+),score=44.97 TRINITY_DN12936_c0_g1_i3:86-787(+)
MIFGTTPFVAPANREVIFGTTPISDQGCTQEPAQKFGIFATSPTNYDQGSMCKLTQGYYVETALNFNFDSNVQPKVSRSGYGGNYHGAKIPKHNGKAKRAGKASKDAEAQLFFVGTHCSVQKFNKIGRALVTPPSLDCRDSRLLALQEMSARGDAVLEIDGVVVTLEAHPNVAAWSLSWPLAAEQKSPLEPSKIAQACDQLVADQLSACAPSSEQVPLCNFATKLTMCDETDL